MWRKKIPINVGPVMFHTRVTVDKARGNYDFILLLFVSKNYKKYKAIKLQVNYSFN
jgi:hypothetical protein